MAINVERFIIPPLQPFPTSGLERLAEDKRFNQQTAYRQQKDMEAEQWRKINLIQELTDLSTYQTGNDVADALGNRQMGEIYQKYTAAAQNLSPIELQARIQKEMSNVIGGMNAIKSELTLADKQLAALKQAYPNIDVASLAKELRADVVNRRIDNTGTSFVNPLQVPQSSVDLSDPEYLANYVTGNKNLMNSIIDPKGTEAETVLMGKQGDYTKFEGKLPFWKTPTYDRNKFNPEGFYTGKDIPSFKIKSSVIPTESLPSSNGKAFEVIDKEVYDRFAQDGGANLELIAATKKAFPTYDKFNPTEKEYAKRNVLFNQIKSLDQSQLHPTSNVRPSVTRNYNTTNVNTGQATINDVYSKIEEATEDPNKGIVKNGVRVGTRMNTLSGEQQNILFSQFGGKNADFNETNTFIHKGTDGVIRLYKVNYDGVPEPKPEFEVGVIEKTGTNLKAQPDVKAKRAVVTGDKKPEIKKEDLRQKYNY